MPSADPERLNELLESLEPPTQELVQAARALIRKVVPDVVEVVWPHQRTMGFGVGPKKMSEQYVYLDIYDKHLNLGFFYGADLDDPEGLLSGTGKLLRHVRIEHPDDLGDPSIRTLIEKAKGHLPRLDG